LLPGHAPTEEAIVTRSACLWRTTRPASKGDKTGLRDDPSVVTGLLLCGAENAFPLRARKKPYELGSASTCDVSIDSPVVSRLHCRLRHKGTKLRVIDAKSTNGTYFKGERDSDFVVKPGDSFMMGSSTVRLLALNDAMQRHHGELLRILGWPEEHRVPSDTPAPAELMLMALDGAPLLIKSEEGCDQDRLARIIHEISRFRGTPIVELTRATADAANLATVKRQARNSTLIIELAENREPIAPELVSLLSLMRHEVRVIVLARSAHVATAVFGNDYVYSLTQLSLRPLSARMRLSSRLLDSMFTECKSPLRMRSMTPHNQAALRAYGWSNLAEMREAATRLASIAWTGSINQTAADLSLVRSTLHDWFTRQLCLRQPLTAASIGA
jgi:hypothetical protein